MNFAVPPSWLILDPLIESWLLEDIGRGDRTTQGLSSITNQPGQATWVSKQVGVVAGLPIAQRVFRILDERIHFKATVSEGETCQVGQPLAQMEGPLDALLTGERVALNLTMHLSGIATLTRHYVEKIADLPAQLVDTRKTTPGLRILEKYATQVGGAVNHRMGLDDGVMVKDNHIAAAGGIGEAIHQIRDLIPYPISIEVETETLEQVSEALQWESDIIMLDNMPLDKMVEAVKMIRHSQKYVKIEASGNITLETIRPIAETGVDYLSSSAPITQSTWLDLSMRIK
ncbi:MAG: carboxylating nicotinate-nucleotide diphosphorylase [Xenococcus sp. MO_188.B8]|nr:carboxylating nicotinate-nucleotide diphosphorylase [Xenococcus sp. MO_188.B8]